MSPSALAALTLAETMISPWIVLPLAGLTMLIVGAHVLAVQVSAMHPLRKRLRIANGLIMMFVAATLAYALGGVTLVADPRQHPEQARAFVIVWAVIVGLLAVVVALAVMDAIGTTAWGWRKHRSLRKEYRESLIAGAAARAASRDEPPPGDAPRG